MNVIAAFEVQNKPLPEVMIGRAETGEEFSDYVREAIDRSQNTEPETRSAADDHNDKEDNHRRPEDDERRTEHDSRRQHDENTRGDTEHRAEQTDVAVDETNDREPVNEAANKTADAVKDTTDNPANGQVAEAAVQNDPAPTVDSSAKATAIAGMMQQKTEQPVVTGETKSKAAIPAVDKATAALAASKTAAPAQMKAGSKTDNTAPNNKLQADTSAKAAPKEPVVNAMAALNAKQPLTDSIDPTAEKRPVRGKDNAWVPSAKGSKQSINTEGLLAKPKSGAGPATDNGMQVLNSAAKAAQAKPGAAPATPPAFTGMLPTGTEMPGSLMAAGDPAPLSGLTQSATQVDATTAKLTVQKANLSAPTPASDQVAVKIASAVRQGVDRISIQLEPQDLGRVDVKLEVSADGRVSATVSADRQDTLDLLQRDHRALERALQQAGLKTDSDSLDFNLRGDRQEEQKSAENAGADGSGKDTAAEDDLIADAANSRTMTSNSALDIRV